MSRKTKGLKSGSIKQLWRLRLSNAARSGWKKRRQKKPSKLGGRYLRGRGNCLRPSPSAYIIRQQHTKREVRCYDTV